MHLHHQPTDRRVMGFCIKWTWGFYGPLTHPSKADTVIVNSSIQKRLSISLPPHGTRMEKSPIVMIENNKTCMELQKAQ